MRLTVRRGRTVLAKRNETTETDVLQDEDQQEGPDCKRHDIQRECGHTIRVGCGELRSDEIGDEAR